MTATNAARWICALMLPAMLAQAAPPRAVPVDVGGDEVLDACGSLGRVHGLKVGGSMGLTTWAAFATAYPSAPVSRVAAVTSPGPPGAR